jgi:hypothetical protein
MPQPVRIWLEISHHTAFRLGGWSFVRADGAQVSGAAGGERQLDLERIGLVGLLAALKDVPAGADVLLRSASDAVALIPARIADAENPPSENLDLWARAMTALKARRVTMERVTATPRTPTAFAAAWAAQGLERAKPKGSFSAAIPKPNLASANIPPA